MSAIDVQSLYRRYGRRWALIDVTFAVDEAKVVMIAGPNGAGKSTLLRVLATAIRPHRGRARILGFDVVRDREEVRRATALLSHFSYHYEALSVRQNMRVCAQHLGVELERIPLLLERVGLASRGRDAVSTLSAGMRKRLSIARLLMQQPNVALLDEPYSELDPEGFTLIDGIVDHLKSHGSTVVIATHQIDRVRAYSDHVIHLEFGGVRWSGPASEAPK